MSCITNLMEMIAKAQTLAQEGWRVLDEMQDNFAYNLSSDSRIAFVEQRDTRLREILTSLAALVESATLERR